MCIWYIALKVSVPDRSKKFIAQSLSTTIIILGIVGLIRYKCFIESVGGLSYSASFVYFCSFFKLILSFSLPLACKVFIKDTIRTRPGWSVNDTASEQFLWFRNFHIQLIFTFLQVMIIFAYLLNLSIVCDDKNCIIIYLIFLLDI